MPADTSPLLTTSAFGNGKQCPKRLWIQLHGQFQRIPEPSLPIDYESSRDLRQLARSLYPGGLSAASDSADPAAQAARTRQLIDSGRSVVFDALFTAGGMSAVVDILVRKGSQWEIVDLRRGTSVKGHYLDDIAFQYYVLRRAGIPVSRCHILHVHNGYVRYGPLMPESLFQRVNVTKAVRVLQSEIDTRVTALLPLLAEAAAMPVKDIGPHCTSPHPCPYIDHCWGHVPSPSIFDIIHLGGARKFDLYYRGVFRQEDLPEGYQLTAVQQMQVRATVSGSTYVDRPRLQAWLAALQYPLCLVDFECFQSAIPLYDGTTPYQQIPFQFSVHWTASPGGAAAHTEFLAEAGPDPRPAFLDALLQATGKAGTVLAYNKAFEVGRLRELARDFPEYTDAIQALVGRMADLMEPFERKWFYVPAMQGSHSIKQVLPALVPGAHYDSLEIGHGQQAAAAFEQLLYTEDPGLQLRIRHALLAYCKLDTEAMVMIMERMYAEAGGYTAPGGGDG